MHNFLKQKSFEFANDNSFSNSDFICSENNIDAFNLCESWPSGWVSNCLVLTGPESSGKSHLAKIWQNHSNALILLPDEIRNKSLRDIISLVNGRNIIIEDIDEFEGFDSQEKIFHIYNKVISSDNYILITSSKPVLAISYWLNDLKSRLVSSFCVNISEPDEDMMRIIFHKHFSDRQLKVSNEVVNFLIPRVERNFSSVKDIVEEIDKRSIELKKAITIPLVKQVLSV